MGNIKSEMLSSIIEVINKNKNPWNIIKGFEKMTLTYSEVAKYIVPFLEQLNEIVKPDENDIDPQIFLTTCDVHQHFTQKYFNCIKENGYYKNVKLDIYKDWICINCESFFDVINNHQKDFVDDLCCPNCGSQKIHWGNTIQKAKIDGKSINEILCMIDGGYKEIPSQKTDESQAQFGV